MMDGAQIVRVIVAIAASTYMFAWLTHSVIDDFIELKAYINQKVEYLIKPKRGIMLFAVSFIMPSIPVAMVNSGLIWNYFFLFVVAWAILSDMLASRRTGTLLHYSILAWSYGISFLAGLLTMGYCLIFG